MTISEYLVGFLNLYEDIRIETNHLNDGSDKFGLFKSPGRDRISNIDGSDVITEYYQLLAKQASNSSYDRADSDAWMEHLTYWVDDFSYRYDYPILDGNRRVLEITLTGCPCPMENTDNETVYQISLSVKYKREKDVN